MSTEETYPVFLVLYDTHANPLTAEPVAMEHLVGIAIQGKAIIECLSNGIFGEHAHSAANGTTETASHTKSSTIITTCVVIREIQDRLQCRSLQGYKTTYSVLDLFQKYISFNYLPFLKGTFHELQD